MGRRKLRQIDVDTLRKVGEMIKNPPPAPPPSLSTGDMLRFNLLTYRDLWAWLNDPFGVPIHEPVAEQLALPI